MVATNTCPDMERGADLSVLPRHELVDPVAIGQRAMSNFMPQYQGLAGNMAAVLLRGGDAEVDVEKNRRSEPDFICWLQSLIKNDIADAHLTDNRGVYYG